MVERAVSRLDYVGLPRLRCDYVYGRHAAPRLTISVNPKATEISEGVGKYRGTSSGRVHTGWGPRPACATGVANSSHSLTFHVPLCASSCRVFPLRLPRLHFPPPAPPPTPVTRPRIPRLPRGCCLLPARRAGPVSPVSSNLVSAPDGACRGMRSGCGQRRSRRSCALGMERPWGAGRRWKTGGQGEPDSGLLLLACCLSRYGAAAAGEC